MSSIIIHFSFTIITESIVMKNGYYKGHEHIIIFSYSYFVIFHTYKYSLVGYFSQLGSMHQVVTLAHQINSDITNLPNHKYIAHQLVLLHVSNDIDFLFINIQCPGNHIQTLITLKYRQTCLTNSRVWRYTVNILVWSNLIEVNQG